MLVDHSYAPTGKQVMRMARVIKNCTKSVFYPYRMSAMLVKSGRVMEIGVNKSGVGEHKYSKYDSTRSIHAELDVILRAARKGIATQGCSIYIAGVTKDENLVRSAPCSVCQMLIKEAGIKDIYYHERDGGITRVKVA